MNKLKKITEQLKNFKIEKPQFKNKIFTSYIFLSIIFFIFTIIPYILGYITTPGGMKFSWLISASLDHISYLEKINNGVLFNSLEFLMRTNYQTDVSGGLIFTLYSGAGLLFSKFGLNETAIFVLIKLLGTFFLLISFWYFLKTFVKKEKIITSTILVFFATSCTNLLTYLTMIFGGNITELNHVPKFLYIFSANLYTPHFSYELGLILLSFIAVKHFHNNKWKYSIINGIILFFISTIHPQVAIFYGLIEGIYLLTEAKSQSYTLKDLLPVSLWGIIPLPYLIYLLVIFNQKFSLQVWLSSNVHPASITTIITFLIPIIILTILLFLGRKDLIKENKLLAIWLVSIALVLIMPKQFQDKLMQYGSVPALIFLAYLLDFDNKMIKKTISIVMIICLLPLVADPILPKRNDTFAYYPNYYETLIEDLNELEYPKIIMANGITSSFMVAKTKQIYPTSNVDECGKFNEYHSAYVEAGKTKDFSFLADIDADYYIFDRYIANMNGTTELEENLPYKILKETENYIIYDLKKPTTNNNWHGSRLENSTTEKSKERRNKTIITEEVKNER